MTKTLTVPQVADHFGISKWTVYRAIDSKQLRAYRVGQKLLRVTLEDAEAWLRSGDTTLPVQAAPIASDASKDDGWSRGGRDYAAAVIASK